MDPEVDALVKLEERIRRAVDLVATLRAERDAALEQLAGASNSSADAAKRRVGLGGFLTERKQVRLRLEKLLAQLDQLGGS
jgi:FtsZ-binding cell division protein ZapB